jgi:hypothetical protein
MKKASNTPSDFSRFCYKIIRFCVRVVYPKATVYGLENLPEEPCILVGNHSQLHGPVMCELDLPFDRAIWCAGPMMVREDVADYAFQDFWSKKPRWCRWFYRIVSYLIPPLSVCIFTNAHTIAVWRDNRIINTFRQTVNALQSGANVVIFPECYDPHNNIVHAFQENFVDVAKLYYKRSGKAVKFVPLYVAPNLHSMYIGKPVDYDPEAEPAAQRSRICRELMDAITQMATSLPLHTVVPFPNLPKRQHPKNLPLTEEKE